MKSINYAQVRWASEFWARCWKTCVVFIAEDPQQCSSSYDAYNPFLDVWRWRKHEDAGESFSALPGLWKVRLELILLNVSLFPLFDSWNCQLTSSFFVLYIHNIKWSFDKLFLEYFVDPSFTEGRQQTNPNGYSVELNRVFSLLFLFQSLDVFLGRFDRERSSDETLFFDCFCSIASKIEVSSLKGIPPRFKASLILVLFLSVIATLHSVCFSW